MRLDAVIFGGGAAGLWLLDELARRGCSALLLEAAELGRGQTVASQGIIHGGLKYTLQGLLTGSATAIRELPAVWRDCLAGRREPDLSATPVRSEFCHLWRTDAVSSRLGMIGARFGLRVAPEVVAPNDRPPILAEVPGTVARLPEQVISPAGFIAALADRHRERILSIDAERGLSIDGSSDGKVWAITLHRREAESTLVLRPGQVVFCAGAGNADLRKRIGLPTDVMQRRPLHMVLLRGNLPEFNGHCVDGAKTRVTITSDADTAGRTVWQVGGQIAEDGVGLSANEVIARTHAELTAVLPGIDLTGVEWSTYRVDRAEGVIPGGKRPETFRVLREGNVVTAWPTKLVLAPVLAEDVAARIAPSGDPLDLAVLRDWPRPGVALPPWETCANWVRLVATGRTRRGAA